MTQQSAKAVAGGRGTRRRNGRIVLRTLIGLAGLGLVAFGFGFVQFAREASGAGEARLPARADGIVVFTGGRDRIGGAIRLLAEGYAKRLLISGVHPDTTEVAIAALAGGREDLFECCIDLGHSALDTIGNASETANWAERQGFSSLIIVTSSYHMPRSLAELGRVLPEARLEGHAISTSSIDLTHWWRTPRAVSLLLSEYVKLLAARARLGLSADPSASGHAGSL